jgi:membrane-associated phospholipid phosphatase
MMFATGVALLLTSAISALVPALDAFVYVDITPAVFARLSAQIYTHVPTLEALRAGTLNMIRLNNLEALVTFPSFHTTGALLFIWTFWTVPYVRWLAVIVNAGLIAATPLVGAHYFIDLAGGGAVAAFSLALAIRLYHRQSAAEKPVARVSPSRA